MIEGSTGSGGRGRRPWQTRDRTQVAAAWLARQSVTATCLLSSSHSTQSLVSQSLSRSASLAFQLARPISRLPPSQTSDTTANRRLDDCTPPLTMKPVVSAFNAWTWCAHPIPLFLPGPLTLPQRCHLRLCHCHPLRHWCSLQDKQPLDDGL